MKVARGGGCPAYQAILVLALRGGEETRGPLVGCASEGCFVELDLIPLDVGALHLAKGEGDRRLPLLRLVDERVDGFLQLRRLADVGLWEIVRRRVLIGVVLLQAGLCRSAKVLLEGRHHITGRGVRSHKMAALRVALDCRHGGI